MAGPLQGVRIVEMGGIGPGPFCGMMLADHGAEVIRIERAGYRSPVAIDPARDPLLRSRKLIKVDLKHPEGAPLVRALAASADGLIEGYRPGVMERLGLGPDVLLGDNRRLVYGRMTGWGQSGPYANAAGHDINYVALSGTLDLCGRKGEKPTPPLNLLGDFGGGGMLLAFGMVAAVLRARETGHGQVVDCAMTDGSALLAAMIWGLHGQGSWKSERGTNLLDTGAHFYDTYECADGAFVALGAIEAPFYAELRRLAGLEDAIFDRQMDPALWPEAKEKLSAVFRTRPRAEWCALLEGTDACFAPVLSLADAPDHPHNAGRGTFVEVGGVVQPAPAPRFSRDSSDPPRRPSAGAGALLETAGFDAERLAGLTRAGVIEMGESE